MPKSPTRGRTQRPAGDFVRRFLRKGHLELQPRVRSGGQTPRSRVPHQGRGQALQPQSQEASHSAGATVHHTAPPRSRVTAWRPGAPRPVQTPTARRKRQGQHNNIRGHLTTQIVKAGSVEGPPHRWVATHAPRITHGRSDQPRLVQGGGVRASGRTGTRLPAGQAEEEYPTNSSRVCTQVGRGTHT